MNNHKKFEELLQGYLDNALNIEEKEAFEKHLKTCKTCKQKLKERKNLLGKLRSEKEEIQCPDYLIDKILKNTTQKQPKTIISSRTIKWRYLAVGAAAILIVVSTVLVNNMDNQNMFATKDIKAKQKGELLLKETETEKAAEKPLEAQEKIAREKKKTEVEKTTKTPIIPSFASPKTETDFTEEERTEEVLLSEKIEGETNQEEILKETPALSRAAESAAPGKIVESELKQIESFGYDSYTDKKTAALVVDEENSSIGGVSEDYFAETRLVFPEEGSVVGEDFEIVLILKNPAEKIEISLDGEKITNYKKTIDSNIIFIGSDSFPALEDGLHFLSVYTTKEESLTFYKEG
jgi:hypothetical protein